MHNLSSGGKHVSPLPSLIAELPSDGNLAPFNYSSKQPLKFVPSCTRRITFTLCGKFALRRNWSPSLYLAVAYFLWEWGAGTQRPSAFLAPENCPLNLFLAFWYRAILHVCFFVLLFEMNPALLLLKKNPFVISSADCAKTNHNPSRVEKSYTSAFLPPSATCVARKSVRRIIVPLATRYRGSA